MPPPALPSRAYLALGSNLGDRAANIHAALKLLVGPELRVTKLSTFLENPAVGGPPNSPDFLNAVAEIETSLDPHALLDRLLNTEAELGRIRTHKWAPRTIDLDIILYDNSVIHSPRLKIPHPLMHQRAFVLQPLAEIAPDARDPISKQTAVELLKQFKENSRRIDTDRHR
ncbi:MAG TPA: 2-amino-4-hydroxy-6-hydroxymethyldihydropteridine diphosphokinase [Tepidisphaeraceae bacterium]|jgi:2-amino-4-hydroxy-6-hydroxymethyldihydropteridine diphosphokinase